MRKRREISTIHSIRVITAIFQKLLIKKKLLEYNKNVRSYIKERNAKGKYFT